MRDRRRRRRNSASSLGGHCESRRGYGSHWCQRSILIHRDRWSRMLLHRLLSHFDYFPKSDRSTGVRDGRLWYNFLRCWWGEDASPSKSQKIWRRSRFCRAVRPKAAVEVLSYQLSRFMYMRVLQYPFPPYFTEVSFDPVYDFEYLPNTWTQETMEERSKSGRLFHS